MLRCHVCNSTAFLCLILLAGCASRTLQLPLSSNDPSNPSAPESQFSLRPDLLNTETSVTAKQPIIEPTMSVSEQTTALSTNYTCPMHSEIAQLVEGKCPKCGMKLVPAEPSKTNLKGKR